MKGVLYFFVAIILFSCDEGESPQIVPVQLKMSAHNSNDEFYTKVPVQFGIIGKGPGQWRGVELSVNGEKIEDEIIQFMQHSFSQPGSYQISAVVEMLNGSKYQIDTLINIVMGPPEFGDLARGENVMFAWRAGASYKILMNTYHGSSVLDYEVLSIDQALQQQGSFQTIDLGWYPDVVAHGVTTSGKLALIYDQNLKIFSESLSLERQLFFAHGKVPRNIFITNNEGILLFDSLSHLILKKVDLTTGNLAKWSTRYVGVEGMTLFHRFFLNESHVATYHVAPDNSKTLLMGVDVAGDVQFSQYFLPPVFISNVTPLSSGGYIISSHISGDEKKFTVLGADASNVVQWTRTFTMNFQSYWNETPGYHTAVKQVGEFVYIFFDNMRCVKLSISGQVVWDKYFYPTSAHFEDVLTTPNGDFIMVGTRQSYANLIDQKLQTDVVCIKINADGLRVD